MLQFIEPTITEMPVRKALNSVLTIARAASRHSGFSVTEIMAHRRPPPLVTVRHIVMYLSRELTTLSLPQIGRHLGNRDHTTILWGACKIEGLIGRDSKISADVVAIRDLAIKADPELGARE